MGRKKITFWLEDRQVQGLKTLCAITRIRQADFAREAFDDLLEKYKKELKQGPKKR